MKMSNIQHSFEALGGYQEIKLGCRTKVGVIPLAGVKAKLPLSVGRLNRSIYLVAGLVVLLVYYPLDFM